jgi:hypothetical protein
VRAAARAQRRLTQGRRKLQFQGDVPAYVTELSQVVFGAIKQTATDFGVLFPDRAMASSALAARPPGRR